eukprot:TRINITY_DN68322_c0_g1_i1.p1 TRINITY_DN68322_c0_g1~~TRINITY_DN68322_c0_g1_i1.p1  ORF type:complete len:301 (-),score=86.66 TRINITY_DN68322_c0_g1_i1:61-963(-)
MSTDPGKTVSREGGKKKLKRRAAETELVSSGEAKSQQPAAKRSRQDEVANEKFSVPAVEPLATNSTELATNEKKSLRKKKKKEREKMLKTRKLEKAKRKRNQLEAGESTTSAPKPGIGKKTNDDDGVEGSGLTVRQKKRLQYKAKLAKRRGDTVESSVVMAPSNGESAIKTKGRVESKSPSKPRKRRSDDSSDDDMMEDNLLGDSSSEEEEVYMGRRARKTAGKGGQGGKGKGKGKKGGQIHRTKAEKRAKRQEKDSTNADNAENRKQRKKGKGKGKGKGKSKGGGKGRKKSSKSSKRKK